MATIAGKNPFKIPRRVCLVDGWTTSTLTGATTLTKQSSQNQRMDPGGASRNVTLPAVTSDDNGYWFHFDNAADANESLVIKNAAGTTIITVLQNGWGDVYVDETGAWTSGGSHVDSVGFASGISVDTIAEATPAAGVTVDGVLLKDGGAVFADAATIEIDTINEATAAAGVTIDTVLIKDGAVTLANGAALSADVISEKVATTGVTIDGLRIKDAAINPVAGGSAFIDLSNISTGEGDIILKDNLASAFEIREAANVYATVVTTNDAERIDVQKLLAFPAVTTVDMADAAHALVLGTAGAGQTKLVGNIVFCDPNSLGASEELTLPAEASSDGLVLYIFNTGGEGIVVKDDAAATIITLDTAQHGLVACNGTTWYGFIGGVT